MSKNTLKKMIVFSSDRMKAIIENMIADEAIIENRSASALIEKHLYNNLMPDHKDARYWLEPLYFGEWGVGDVLHAVFSANAAGTRGAWSSKWDNLLPLVQFALSEECLCNTLPTGKEEELHHFCSQLDSICEKLESLAKDEESPEAPYYANEAKYARDLLKEAKEEPQYMRYINFYQLVIENWEILKGWSIPFRMLCDLSTMQKGWRNTPEVRYKLSRILSEISKEWD